MNTETIAAAATAMMPAGIGVIRISGEDTFAVADRIFKSAHPGPKVSEMESHTIHYGYIMDDGEQVDEVMLLIMRGPKSYTCEDTVEIDTHGGAFVMQRVLQTVLKNGARLAEPGEFTKRAFLNGRIDLTQAESVIDIINAKNDNALKASMHQLQGNLRDKIIELREKILHETAFIESALDDPEHYTLDGYLPKLKKSMQLVDNDIEHLLRKADDGRYVREGINTVIVGKPNVGKSSLLNRMIGEERAIVTDVAGTTRDVLQETIQLDGITLNVMDTAGIHQTDDVIEKIGVEKSKKALEEADLIIFVADSSLPLDESDDAIIEQIRAKNVIVLLNKSDLKPKTTADDINSRLDKPVISVSMKNGDGLVQFEETIRQMFFHGEISFNDEIYISNLRQKEALSRAKGSMDRVMDGISQQMPEDFLTIDLMDAYTELGTIIGEAVEDDLVDRIFSEFCMGK